MRSSDLVEFGQWQEFRHANENAPREPGVYVVRMMDAIEFSRILGSTDIIYIGHTKNLKRRMYGYRNPGRTQYTNQKLNEFATVLGHDMQVAWRLTSDEDSAQQEEHQLLFRYKSDHHELPPLNGANVRQIKMTLQDGVHLKESISFDLTR